MPSRRYVMVEGIPGNLVSDPHNLMMNPARFAGWDHTPLPEGDADHLEEHYTPSKQVFADHIDLRKAISHTHLKLHGTCEAKSLDEARTKLGSNNS